MNEDERCRVDMHVKVLNESVVERAKARNVDAVVYAPHFTRLPEIRDQAERFSDDDFAVIPGRELLTGHWNARRHVLAVGLAEPVPDFVTLRGTMDELDRQDATVLVPHPGFLNASFSSEEVAEYGNVVDAVEVDNAKFLRHNGRRARRIAAENNQPGYGSSYAHLPGTVGTVVTVFDRPIRSASDLAAALGENDATIDRRRGVGTWLRYAAEFGHLLWEGTWAKADRILLQGTEPTHPGHVAYGGRFDDVRVY